MKRIGIIGAPCIDEVISPSGEMTSQAFGGILYSYAAIERAIGELNIEVECFPITWTSIPDRELILPFYKLLTHFKDITPLLQTEALTNRVRLVYQDDANRTEHCPSILPELTPAELSWIDLGSLDGLFINMISGFDISLETMRWIRGQTKAHIHLDVHAMVLGTLSIESNEPRKLAGRSDWRQWLACVDSVQMNELESDWLGAYELNSELELLQEIRRLFNSKGSPQTVIVTRAERGATSFDFIAEKIWKKDPMKRPILNTTGSGDVFGAIYTLAKTLGASEQESLYHAESWAGWNTELSSLEEILYAPLSSEITA